MPDRLPDINEVFYLRCVCLQVLHADRPGGARPTVVFQPMNDQGQLERAQMIGMDQLGVGPEFITYRKEKIKWLPPRNG